MIHFASTTVTCIVLILLVVPGRWGGDGGGRLVT
jgi:hypothetical protein